MRLNEFKSLYMRAPEEKKEEQGLLGVIGDSLLVGSGRAMTDTAEILERLLRPKDVSAEEWHNNPDISSLRFLQDAGNAITNKHYREYEPGSAAYYGSQALQSLPESLGVMIASGLLGNAIAPGVGGLGNFARSAITNIPKLGRTAELAGKAFQSYLKGNTWGSRAARAFTPDARTLSTVIPATAMEAELEAQNVINQALALGYSQEEAEQMGADARLKNAGIIGLTNIPQHRYFFGRGFNPSIAGMTRPIRQGLLGKAGTFAGVTGFEATEEGLQEIANQSALGQGYDTGQVADAAIVGALMGGGMNAIGRVGNRIINGREPSYEEQLADWRQANKNHSRSEADKYARKKYETKYGEGLRLQSQYEANREYANTITAKQAEIWDAAQYASRRAKEKFGYDIQPELIYKQWAHESGTNFDSENARYNNNFGGLTQTEPNGEENKQPDGSNYYRHFNNVREYADAYVDDFIKYYPEISGTKNEREFASVLKKHGYFGDTVDNYASSMEGITAPSSQIKTWDILGVENYNMPTQSSRIDNQVASLKDGWQTVIPQIGGVLREKFGINAEISSAARSAEHNAEVGGVPTSYHIVRDNGGDALDIVFDRETSQEEQDAIADYFRNTGLFSEVLYHDVGSGAHLHLGGLKTENLGVQGRADQLYNQRINEGWRREQTETQQAEPSKPSFDINSEDSTTQRLIDQFINESFQTAVDNNDAQTTAFLLPMIGENDQFQNTPENRQVVYDRYGDELSRFVQDNLPKTQEQPTTPAAPKSTPPQQGTRLKRDQAIRRAGNNFLEELRKEQDQSKGALALSLQNALNTNKLAEVERMLKANNVAIPMTLPTPSQTQPSQPQEQPVKENRPPENILPQPPQSPTLMERAREILKQVDKTRREAAIANGKPIQTRYESLRNIRTNPQLTSERIQSLDTNEVPATVGENDFESENYRTQTLREAVAEDERRRQEQPQAQARQQQLRMNYSDIDSNENQTGQPARQINENIINPDEMIGGNIAQRIRDNEDARARKISDKHVTEPNEGAATGIGRNPNPDEMIGNIAKAFAHQQASPTKSEQKPATKNTPPENILSQTLSRGKQATVDTDSGNQYASRYRIIEADDLEASHYIENGNVSANPNYRGVQPRNRDRVAMQANLIRMAQNLNPDKLMEEAQSANLGAPTIRNDGTVLNGNGRTAAIRYAYDIGKGDNYKAALIQKAKQYGLNADDISKMNRPVLVREIAQDLNEDALKDIANATTGGSRLGASEQAQADGAKITDATLARFPQGGEVSLNSKEAADFVRAVLNQVATPDELNALTDKDGQITQDGINRVMRALFARAYGNAAAVDRMAESFDDNVKGATTALTNAAPLMAKIKNQMSKGQLHDYDLSAFTTALEKLSSLRNQGMSVHDFLNQGVLFDEAQTPQDVKEILQTFDAFKRSGKKLSAALKRIGQKIQEQGNPKQMTLDGKRAQAKDFASLIKEAREDITGHSLFSRRGEGDTRIDNFVDDKDLTPQQKLIKSFGKKLGVQTVFFRNEDGDFNGAHSNGTTYLNVNSKMPLGKIFWHESLHWLKANNPELYKQWVKAVGITDEQRQAYLDETERTDLETDAAIDEEIVADQFEDVAKRNGILQSIAGKNRSLIERVVQWLKDTMNKFIDHFRNPDGKLTTKQAQDFADEFGRIANQLVDQNGNKIFRYNRRTHNVELADGRQLEETPFNENELREKVAKGEREGTIKYSVGNNNNSSESLAKKLRSTFPSIFGTSQNRRRKVITDNLRRLSGHRILYGYIDGADDIVVDHLQKLIQSRNAYDWDKLLPVVGKEIAQNLNLNATQAQSNYIADWLLTGAFNNTSSPEAKAFQKAMRDNPAMAEVLQETRDIFNEIANMTPEEKLRSTLIDRPAKSFWKEIFKGGFTEEILDDLQPLQDLVDKAIKNSNTAVAQAIKQGVNVKQLAQMARGRGAIANLMINGKPERINEIRATLAERYAGVYFTKFKPLNAIIESVGGDWKGLGTYSVAKLIKEVYEYNRAHPEDQKTIYSGMTESEVDQIIKNGAAKFDKAQEDLVHFSKTLLAIQYESGLLTDNQFFRILNSWKNYVPMARVFDENENYDKFDPLKRREGHADDTWSPIQTLIAHTHKAIQACEQNKVKLELATLVRFGGFDSNLSEIPKSNLNVDNIITFRENGKIKYLETPDPAIKRAIDAMQSQSESTWLMKMLKATAGFMRAAYTMSNPDFAAGNLFRDLPDAFIHNKQLGNTAPIIDMVRAFCSAFKSVWTNDADFIEWQTHGGAQASFVSEDVDYIQRSINDATTTRKQRYLSRHFASQLLDDFQRLSEFTENITRVASYKMAKNALAKAGKTGITGKQLAALAAREAAIDFSKAGRSTRALNKGVLFANAAVQGLNQWIEAGREARKGNTKLLFGKVFRLAATAVLPAMLQFAFANGDNDRKKEYAQAPDWEKETYWILGGLRIPKGMDVGLRLAANLTDEFLSSVTDKRSVDWGRVLGTPLWNALPSLTATLITPAVEVELNKSYFRDAPIDPKSEQHLPAHMRYDTSTSSVAKWFGELTGWSPRKIDYLINGYLGFMGRFATHAPNYLERGIGMDEFPMVRRFIFTPYKNPKIVKEYYEAYEEQEQLYNEYKLKKLSEPLEGYDSRLHKRIKSSYDQMHKISKQEKLVLQDENLTHDERKMKLQELEKRRVAIAERVFQGAR